MKHGIVATIILTGGLLTWIGITVSHCGPSEFLVGSLGGPVCVQDHR